MLILGLVLLVIGWVVGLQLLIWAGIILLVVGLILLLTGGSHPVGGRRYWY